MICSGSPRSVSLPIESNAIITRISRQLKKLKALEESSTSAAETISNGLCGIADLYKCICDMLSLPLTQQSLCLHQHQKCVGELLEVSSKLLEVCSSTREMALEMKEASAELRSSLDASSQESSVARFICLRKKIMKRSRQNLESLKRIGGESLVSLGFFGDADEQVSAVIQALKCISFISISVQESALLFLGLKPKCGGRKSVFSKLISKRKGLCEDEDLSRNELENADAAICGLSSESDEKKIRLVCKRLEVLEVGIEGIENGLNSVFLQLTQTRMSLLKISHS